MGAILLFGQNQASETFCSKFIVRVRFCHMNPFNRCKRVLEAAKLAYANKTKGSITFQKLGSCDFWRIANNVLNKGKSAIPPVQQPRGVVFCI